MTLDADVYKRRIEELWQELNPSVGDYQLSVFTEAGRVRWVCGSPNMCPNSWTIKGTLIPMMWRIPFAHMPPLVGPTTQRPFRSSRPPLLSSSMTRC